MMYHTRGRRESQERWEANCWRPTVYAVPLDSVPDYGPRARHATIGEIRSSHEATKGSLELSVTSVAAPPPIPRLVDTEARAVS